LNAKNNELTGPAMINYITNSLNEFEKFSGDAKNNINIKNRNTDDVFELLSVKENLHNIKERKDKYFLELDVVEQCLAHLHDLDI